MENLPTLAQTLAQYGPWGFCALLTLAVVYLFRLYIELQKELRESIQTNLKDTIGIVESAKKVMEKATESIHEQKATTESLREIVRILSGSLTSRPAIEQHLVDINRNKR